MPRAPLTSFVMLLHTVTAQLVVGGGGVGSGLTGPPGRSHTVALGRPALIHDVTELGISCIWMCHGSLPTLRKSLRPYAASLACIQARSPTTSHAWAYPWKV